MEDTTTERPVEEVSVQSDVQSDAYPFTWTDLSDEEKKERKRIYTAEGPWCVSPKASMLVRSSNSLGLFTAYLHKTFTQGN
jgi:hypothetical protein